MVQKGRKELRDESERQRHAEIQHQTQALALQTLTHGREQIITQILKHRHGVWCAGETLGLRDSCFTHPLIQPFTP